MTLFYPIVSTKIIKIISNPIKQDLQKENYFRLKIKNQIQVNRISKKHNSSLLCLILTNRINIIRIILDFLLIPLDQNLISLLIKFIMRNNSRGYGGHRSYGNSHNHTSHSMVDHHRHNYYAGGGGTGFNHHGGHQYRGAKNVGAAFERVSDLVFNHSQPPYVTNGKYYFTGNQKSFRSQVENPNLPSQQQNLQNVNLAAQQKNMPIQKVSIDIVGNKTKPSNECCYCTTVIFASFLLFPLCFMCCTCWKKIVYPMYDLPVSAYNDMATFIKRFPDLNKLDIKVIDNAFNAEKARIIYEILSQSRIQFFQFSNGTLDCNGQFNEADDFKNNMLPIKSFQK